MSLLMLQDALLFMQDHQLQQRKTASIHLFLSFSLLLKCLPDWCCAAVSWVFVLLRVNISDVIVTRLCMCMLRAVQ